MAYPKKMISPSGAVIVLAKQEVHEAELVAQGYKEAPATVAKAPEPTPCAKCAELEAQVSELQTKLAKALEPKPAPAAEAPAKPKPAPAAAKA